MQIYAYNLCKTVLGIRKIVSCNFGKELAIKLRINMEVVHEED